jgi:hypothetical protein
MAGKKLGDFDAFGMKGNAFDPMAWTKIIIGTVVGATAIGIGLKGATWVNNKLGFVDTSIVNPIKQQTTTLPVAGDVVV